MPPSVDPSDRSHRADRAPGPGPVPTCEDPPLPESALNPARVGRLSTGELDLLVELAELVRVAHGEDPRDPPVLDDNADDGGAAHLVLDPHADATVERDGPDHRIDRQGRVGPQEVHDLL